MASRTRPQKKAVSSASLVKRMEAMAPVKATSPQAVDFTRADPNPLLSEPKTNGRMSTQAHEERIAVAFLDQCQHSLDTAKTSTGDARRFALDDLRLYAEKAALQAARAS